MYPSGKTHPEPSAKLHWYGLSPLSLKFIFSYFSNRNHWPKIKEHFSNRLKIEYGVPQGSILGPIFFNVNSIDMLHKCEDSDDTTPYACEYSYFWIANSSQ